VAAGGRRASRCAPPHWPRISARCVRASKGGQYKPLTEAEIARIHSAVLDALEVVGLSQAPQSGVEA
jgi:trimethylamine--corrinoid protein Co-methyltransferase